MNTYIATQIYMPIMKSGKYCGSITIEFTGKTQGKTQGSMHEYWYEYHRPGKGGVTNSGVFLSASNDTVSLIKAVMEKI